MPNRIAKLLVLAVLLLTTMGQSYNMPFSPQPVAGGPTTVSDDFDRADNDSLGSNWAETIGDMDILSTNIRANLAGEALWSADVASARQSATVQRGGYTTNDFCGLKMRAPNLSGTGNSYVIRWQNKNVETAIRECVGTSCSDIYLWAHRVDLSDYISMEVIGTGSSTEFMVWDHGTSNPGARSTWGDADLCICDGGAPCTSSDCGTATIIDDEPGTGNYGDCGSGCYVGVYHGNASQCDMDDWAGEWD